MWLWLLTYMTGVSACSRAAFGEPVSDDNDDASDVYSPNKALLKRLGGWLLPFYIIVPLILLYFGGIRFKVGARFEVQRNRSSKLTSLPTQCLQAAFKKKHTVEGQMVVVIAGKRKGEHGHIAEINKKNVCVRFSDGSEVKFPPDYVDIAWAPDETEIASAQQQADADYDEMSFIDRVTTLTWRRPRRELVADIAAGAKYQVRVRSAVKRSEVQCSAVQRSGKRAVGRVSIDNPNSRPPSTENV